MTASRTKRSSRFRDASSRPDRRSSGGSRERKTTRKAGVKNGLLSGTASRSNTRSGKTLSRSTASAHSQRDWGAVRLACVGLFFGMLWLTLWWRAWNVQIEKGPELAERARRQHIATELVSGQRGEIIDRNGQLLARSVESLSVFARPVEMTNTSRAAAVLAKALGRSPQAIRGILKGKRRFVWVARKVSDRAAAMIRDAKVPGVYLTKEYQRLYPNRQLAGKLLGFVGLDDKGLEGLELAFNATLHGESSKQVVQRDAAGRKLYLHGTERDGSLRGQDVRLTLDAQIQFFAEDALAKAVTAYKGTWGGALVVEVTSGDILAWAEFPSFNPNAYRSSSPARWRNRIATDALEPGSTAKPFLIAAALEEGIVKPDSLYFCENGRWKLHGVRIKDTHKYEWLSVEQVLRYSSNIGVAKIGLELGATAYSNYLDKLGFGRRTGVPLKGEATGIVRPANRWRQVDLANASFGQGFSTTLLQLAQAYTVLANGGVMKPLRIIADSEGTSAPLNEPVAGQHTEAARIFSSETADAVLKMLRNVVEEDGTGTQARLPGIVVGGKTGTAQKASPEGGYGGLYSASFVGLFPAMAPEYVVVVVVDEPAVNHYGGIVAAPAFKSIALRTLAYRGTLPDNAVHDAEDGAPAQPKYSGTNVIATQNSSGISEIRQTVATAGKGFAKQVPNVVGGSLRRAVEAFVRKGVVPEVRGSGVTVIKQKPAAGTQWPATGTAQYILWVTENAS